MTISPISASLIIKNNKTGEEYKLGDITEIEEIGDRMYPEDPYGTISVLSMVTLTGTFIVTADGFRDPKVRMKLYGITNNYIRMHGGKPMRTLPRRFKR